MFTIVVFENYRFCASSLSVDGYYWVATYLCKVNIPQVNIDNRFYKTEKLYIINHRSISICIASILNQKSVLYSDNDNV